MHINIWQRVGVPLAVLIAVVFLGAGSPLGAQSVATVARTSIDTTLTRAALDDLPSGGTAGGLLETTVPEIISDRIDGGGLSESGLSEEYAPIEIDGSGLVLACGSAEQNGTTLGLAPATLLRPTAAGVVLAAYPADRGEIDVHHSGGREPEGSSALALQPAIERPDIT